MNIDLDRSLKRNGLRVIAGVDEVGRGALAGPLVACAAIIPHKFPKKIFDLIADSKSLSQKKREEIYLGAISSGTIYKLAIISSGEVDEIGLQSANLKALSSALSALPMNPDIALIDGYYVGVDGFNTRKVIKGDTVSKSIGLASIIAKVARDKIMCELDQSYPDYEFKNNKGYGTRTHINAIFEFGTCEQHRISFKPISTMQ